MMTRTQPAPFTTCQTATLVELLRTRAVEQTDALAYSFLPDGETREASLSYGELDRQARRIGAQLQQIGATGERVLLLYPAGLDYIAAFFGCLYAGAVAVPAYPPRFNRSVERLQAIAHDARARVALSTAPLVSKIRAWGGEDGPFAAMQWLDTTRTATELEDAWTPPTLTPDALAFLQYTSGSTGRPKGVMLSHDNLLYNVRMIQEVFQDTPHTAIVGWLPMYHDMGLIGNILTPLHLGIPCILMPPIAFLQRPFRWLQAISRYRATASGGPNFAYDLCVRKVTPEKRATLDLSCWKLACSGAEPVRAETLARFADAFAGCGFRRDAFLPCYGLAESTLMVSGRRPGPLPSLQTVKRTALEKHQVVAARTDDEDAHTLVSCGQTLLAQQARIVNPDTRVECPMGEVGEIWVRGPSVAQGYWGRPQETAETFGARLADTQEGPFLRTGDLGFVCAGELYVTGRLKDVIIIRGSNHYPQDIELTVEQSHPALRAGCGAAFTVEAAGEEQLVVVQEVERRFQPPRRPSSSRASVEPGREPDDPAGPTLEAVVGNIRQAVAEQHGVQVAAVVLLRSGSVPKTSSGKIQRHACKRGFLEGSLETVGAWGVVPTSVQTDAMGLGAHGRNGCAAPTREERGEGHVNSTTHDPFGEAYSIRNQVAA